jgi:Leucine-rich repeat (LRR) protein
MESARDLDPFVTYFLKGKEGRENASKRGVMKRIDINARVPINLIDWEIANRRVELEKKERTNKLSFYNLFIDSVPDQAMQFEGLTHLSVCSTLVTTVEPFGVLRNLQVLDCSYIQLDSLTGLSVGNLEQLFCGVTNVQDITVLQDAHKLQRLYMGSTDIADLTPLRNCPELVFLSCEDTLISSLDGLENCTKLTYIDCSDTAIRNLDPIAGLPNLEDVILNGCHIDASLERLCSIPTLKKLTFYQGTAEGVPADILSRESYENCLSRLREFYRQRRKLTSNQ